MFDDRVASALAYTEDGLQRFGYLTHTDLSVRCLRGAIATPRAYHADRTFTGAVYDAAGRLVESTQRHNAGDIVAADPPLLAADVVLRSRQRRVGSALYGGILFPILGHFLVESVSRLWPLLSIGLREPRVCFHHWPSLHLDQVFANPLYAAILQTFGLARENIELIEEDCSFDTLLLPDPASRYHVDINPLMASVADHISCLVAEPQGAHRPSPHLYLSRSRWTENTRIRNESVIDDWAQSRGLQVVHPQEVAPGTLMRLLTRAETVVASDGSHAHLTMFCRPQARVLLLDTRPVPTQFALARLRGYRTLHLPLFERPGYDSDQRMVDPHALEPLIETALAQLYS